MTYPSSHPDYSSYTSRYSFSNHPPPQSPPPHPQAQTYSQQGQHTSQNPQTHYPKPSYVHNPHLHSHIPVKVEESTDLPPVSSLTSYDQHLRTSSALPNPIFRFGPGADISASASPTTPTPPFTFMSQQTWPSSSTSPSYAHPSTSQQHQRYSTTDRYSISSPVSPINGQSHHALALAEDYEDDGGDDLADLSSNGMSGMGSHYGSGTGSGKADKQVRRRSSKACDQCRKSKCKCERTTPREPCRNCVMLGTQCTFLGPSRKRGPPKGYIDAIEARLHQTEALIGILLSSKDSRAKGLLEDLAQDPLAKEIINRVDNSPYGYKGRSRGAEAPTSRARGPEQREGDGNSVHTTHPSNEWQDRVVGRLNSAAASRNTILPEGNVASESEILNGEDTGSRPSTTASSSTQRLSSGPQPQTQESTHGARRQRRRLDEEQDGSHHSRSSASSHSPSWPQRVEQCTEDSEEGGEDEFAVAVGQLSLNEDEQVRFHGKMSGLHLLGAKELKGGRNEGGIWRFPKARVWPPLPPAARSSQRQSDDFVPRLPDVATQELLLELYFTYVHPVLPIVHQHTLLEDFREGNLASGSPYSYSEESGLSDVTSSNPATSTRALRRRPVPTVLLLAMFSIAARHSLQTADVPPSDDGSMWTAGDEYMEDAKVILDRTYAASRPSTCQALLLLGYREVGIGAMAQAWLYIGMAVRMAQDLGLHKSAEEWTSVGRSLFTRAELQERRRIWYGCVVMDKYVSTYIGRPVAIYERDFDTELPTVDEEEETALWRPHPSPAVAVQAVPGSSTEDIVRAEEQMHEIVSLPGHILSCFNESAKLSIILSEICQNIYAIKPPMSRPAELARLDSQLTKWSLELPEHLRFDPASPRNPPPPPNVLTLHMQYWCTVLLLHRPFIRHIQDSSKILSPGVASKEAQIHATSREYYDMCVQAANHVTLIVSIYHGHFSASRASVFLCYYVFTAAIMHVATVRTYPDDLQATRGLDKCMNVMQRMSLIWPSSWRALELLIGAKAEMRISRPLTEPSALRTVTSELRNKRAAEDAMDSEDIDITMPDHPRLLVAHQPRDVYRPLAGYPVVSSHGQCPPSRAHSQQQQQSYPSLQMDVQQQQQQPEPQSSDRASGYMPPSYDGWQTDPSSSLSNFGGSISTSVLPQQYSTGLVDARMSNRSSERQTQRYPQYWNDYSALGQMETTYGVPVVGETSVSQQHGEGAGGGQQPAHNHPHSHSHSQAHPHQQTMYVQDHQYNMFGNMPPSGQQ